LVRLQRNIIKGIKPLYYFSERNFNFNTDKLNQLFDELDADDKVRFNFDHSVIDWTDFMIQSMGMARKLIFKEGPETIPAAQKKLKILYFVNVAIKVAFGSLVAYWASKCIFL